MSGKYTVGRAQRLGAAVRHARHGEALRGGHVMTVQLGDHEVVVDDQDLGHHTDLSMTTSFIRTLITGSETRG
jgi:hypothetical protein